MSDTPKYDVTKTNVGVENCLAVTMNEPLPPTVVE